KWLLLRVPLLSVLYYWQCTWLGFRVWDGLGLAWVYFPLVVPLIRCKWHRDFPMLLDEMCPLFK
ncbi:hypothetical protein BS47DRAFT_209167, partial [Hydnum rufescens UP504]